MNELQPPSESVVRKIQKLLSLATGGNNSEEEMSSAMAMAQKMLAEYNLDFHTVQAAQVAGGTNAVEEKREKTLIQMSAQYKWQRELWGVIAAANFCWHWVAEIWTDSRFIKKKIRAKRHMLLGRESNVISVKLMGEYLCSTIESLVPYPKAERLSRSAISWRAGCSDRLSERIKEQHRKATKDSEKSVAGSTALSLRNVVDREYEANYDALHGKGAYAEHLASEAKWEARAEERRALRAEQVKEAERILLEQLQNETPLEKAKREKQEEKERLQEERRRERSANTYWNQRYRESSSRDEAAYAAGSRAGARISLNKQAGAGKSQERLV